MLSIPGVAHDQIWYEQSLFYNSNFFIPNKSASPFKRMFLEKNQSQDNLSLRPRMSPLETSFRCFFWLFLTSRVKKQVVQPAHLTPRGKAPYP